MNSSKNNKRGGYWNQSAPCTEEEVAGLMLANIKLLLQKKESDIEPKKGDNTELGDFSQSLEQQQRESQQASRQLVSPVQSPRQLVSLVQAPPLQPQRQASASLVLSQQQQQASAPPESPVSSQSPSQSPSQRPSPPRSSAPPAPADIDANKAFIKSSLQKIQGLNFESLQTSIENVSTALAVLSPEQYDEVLTEIQKLRQNFLRQP